jgi:hypothetical protein
MGTAAFGPSGTPEKPGNIFGGFNPYTLAPNSAHILWANAVTIGGLVGGGWGSWSYGGMGPTMGALAITPAVETADFLKKSRRSNDFIGYLLLEFDSLTDAYNC